MPVTVLANKQPHDLPDDPNFKVLLHQQGIKVDVPGSIEVNPISTIAIVQTLTQKQWTHISTGPLFKELFFTAFDPADDNDIQIPEKIEDLQEMDYGVQHISGLIIQSCEAIFDHKGPGRLIIFFRNPETYCHPKVERRLVNLLKKIQNLAGAMEKENTATTEESNTQE